MNNREVKFRFNIEGTSLIIDSPTLYPDGMIGMSPDDFESQLPEGFKHDSDALALMKGDEKVCEVMQGDEWIFIESKYISLMQYVGLKDKNLVEIYEGDIVVYIGSSMSTMEIKFQNGAFVGEGPFNTHPLPVYLNALDFESIEVIGNIHENKDLLA
jgi:uncharacterized phage protein (TIGR01671 family)